MQITQLEKGMANKTYLLSDENIKLVMKVFSKATKSRRNNETLPGYGEQLVENLFGPKVYSCCADFIITEFIQGQHPHTLSQERLIRQLYQIHNLRDYSSDEDLLYQRICGMIDAVGGDTSQWKQIVSNYYPKGKIVFGHGDVKPENLIVSNKSGKIYWIDFDLCGPMPCTYDLAKICRYGDNVEEVSSWYEINPRSIYNAIPFVWLEAHLFFLREQMSHNDSTVFQEKSIWSYNHMMKAIKACENKQI